MREKLIELIKHEVVPYFAERIADHLNANGVTFATDNNVGGKWIPVTERLPEFGKSVIATDGVVVGEMYFASTKHWHRYNGISWENFADTSITHWMPLPEPPKEGAV